MKYEIITLKDTQIIGMAKEIAFNNPAECAKFWVPTSIRQTISVAS